MQIWMIIPNASTNTSSNSSSRSSSSTTETIWSLLLMCRWRARHLSAPVDPSKTGILVGVGIKNPTRTSTEMLFGRFTLVRADTQQTIHPCRARLKLQHKVAIIISHTVALHQCYTLSIPSPPLPLPPPPWPSFLRLRCPVLWLDCLYRHGIRQWRC